MNKITLYGITGHHLWGFLAALGTFALLDEESRARRLSVPRLSFQNDGTAIVQCSIAAEQIASALLNRLRQFMPFLEKNLASINKPSDFSRSNFETILSNHLDLKKCDFLAGLACVVSEEASESTLCAANGASHQNLIQSMRDVIMLVEEEHISLALFKTWSRSFQVPDERRKQLKLGSRKPTLRLDPADERLYALRLSNPTTTDDFSTEIGAQALAIPAFGLFPVVPSKYPVTVSSKRSRQCVTFSWPLWYPPSTLASVRSLLWQGVDNAFESRQRGVFTAFCANRVSGAKGKLSFSPSEGLW
jgi:hypothetical protein